MAQNTLQTAFNIPVKLIIDDEEINIPHLSVYEIADKCVAIKEKRLAETRKLMAEFNIGGLDGMRQIQAIQNSDPIINDLWAEVATSKGAINIITAQLKTTGKNDEQIKVILKKTDHEALIENALKVCGWVKEEEDDKKGGKSSKKAKKTGDKEEDAPGFPNQ